MSQRRPRPLSMPQLRDEPPLSLSQPRLHQLFSMNQRKPPLPSMPQQREKLPHSLPQLTPLLHLMPQPREKPLPSLPQPTPLLPSMPQQKVKPPHSERGVFFVKHNKQKGISIEVRFQFEFREYSLYEIDNGYKCLSILYK